MLKLLLYDYSHGFRSSLKLERAPHHNLSFIWLMGDLKPDHKTIAEFRRKNKKAIAKVLKPSASLCTDLDLIVVDTLFIDGSKFRVNAGIKNTWTKARCEKFIKKIDTRIETILTECEKVDKKEQEQSSLVEMKEDLKDQKTLKYRARKILKEPEAGKIDDQGIQVVVISQRQASGRGVQAFDKYNFQYDPQRDCYICPEMIFIKYITSIVLSFLSSLFQVHECAVSYYFL